MKPLVSLLIPCYRHEDFLDDCLNSVIAQTYENIELLICDDCSPDGSYQKILSYEPQLRNRFPRVEILRNEQNCGVTKNINRMLRMAKGQYVKTLASDDAMAPTAIQQMAAYLDAHPEMDVVIANGCKVSEQEHYPDFTPQGKIYETTPDFSPDGFFLRTARCNEISAPAAMVRMTVYQRFGFYDEQVKVEDYEFWLRILKDGACRFGYLNEDLLYYRINANSMTSMVNNPGIIHRRRVFHQSQMDTLSKYRTYFKPQDYALIAMEHILTEIWFTSTCRLPQWEQEVKQEWKSFPYKQDLRLGDRIRLQSKYAKQALKRILKK